MNPLIFCLPGYSGPLPLAESGHYQPCNFLNGELVLQNVTLAAGKICIIVGDVRKPEQLLTLTLLAHTLQRIKAKRITAFLPYLPYARQDSAIVGQSLGIAWFGSLLKGVGVDLITTIDLHSHNAAQNCPLPIKSLSPVDAFFKNIKLDKNTLVVAPDMGATQRASIFATKLGLPKALVVAKKRTKAGVIHTPIGGQVLKNALIVDDVLDTGETLVSCCKALQKKGVKKITLTITHGLFTGSYWRELWNLGVNTIYVGDSLPLPAKLKTDKRIKICSLEEILKQGDIL